MRSTSILVAVLLIMAVIGRQWYVRKYDAWLAFGATYHRNRLASPTLHEVQLLLVRDGAEVEGPSVVSNESNVVFEDRDGDKFPEAVVWSTDRDEHYAVFKLIVEEGRATGFRVVEVKAIEVIDRGWRSR